MVLDRKSIASVAVILMIFLVSSCSSEEKKDAAPTVNASVIAHLQEDRVVAGGQVSYNMTITNLGEANGYDIAIEHRIFSTPAARVVKTEGEIVKMDQQWIYKDKKLDLPSDSEAGDYQLIIAMSYGENQTAQAGAFFTVSKPVEEINKSSGQSSVTAAQSDAEDTSAKNETGADAVQSTQANTSDSPTQPITQNTSSVPAGKEVVVVHQDRKFTPDKVFIEPGDTVVWIQKDKTSGEVAGAGFSSGPLGPGKEFRHTFKKVGIFDFYSQLTKAYGTVTVDDPENPTVRKRDPMSFQGGLNS